MITECCNNCRFRYDCEDYSEEDSEEKICGSYESEWEVRRNEKSIYKDDS